MRRCVDVRDILELTHNGNRDLIIRLMRKSLHLNHDSLFSNPLEVSN